MDFPNGPTDNITMTAQWASLRLELPATTLFGYPFV